MKRGIAAAVLSAVVAALFISGLVITSRSSERLSDSAKRVALDYGSGERDAALEGMQALETQWEHDEKLLCIFKGRETLGNISAQLLCTRASIEHSDGTFYENSALLASMLDDLYGDEELSVRLLF